MSILSNLQSRLRIKATHSRILAITLIILYHGDSNRSPNHVALAPHTPHYITTTSSTRNKGEMKAYLPEQLRWLLMLVDENQGPCFSGNTSNFLVTIELESSSSSPTLVCRMRFQFWFASAVKDEFKWECCDILRLSDQWGRKHDYCKELRDMLSFSSTNWSFHAKLQWPYGGSFVRVRGRRVEDSESAVREMKMIQCDFLRKWLLILKWRWMDVIYRGLMN